MEQGTTLGRLMTMNEIQSRFDAEWVFLEDPETSRENEVLSGIVRWHSPDRDEVYRKAEEIGPKHWAILFVGRQPKDVEYLL